MKLFKKPSRLLLRSNFFTQRVISTWNALPEEVVLAPTVSIFKASLDSHWTDNIDINKGLEPELYFVIECVYINLNNKK